MRCSVFLSLLATFVVPTQAFPREAVYGGAVTVGGQVVPLFANGYLIYVHRPNRLQVFRPDTQVAFEYDVPCPPGASSCSVAGVAVSRTGLVALGIGYAATTGYTSAIRVVDQAGKEIRSFSTGRYVPLQLSFDKNGDLWAMGWQRDELVNDRESETSYNVVRKYSPEGTLSGEFLPTTLWPGKHGPQIGGRGYWTMYAADDRMGALFNDNYANAGPEWLEWDLSGALRSRTPLSRTDRVHARAFNSKGRLYGQFLVDGNTGQTELRVLDSRTGRWIPARTNLPDETRAILLGADGDELVYRLNGSGNVHLVWSRPDCCSSARTRDSLVDLTEALPE